MHTGEKLYENAQWRQVNKLIEYLSNQIMKWESWRSRTKYSSLIEYPANQVRNWINSFSISVRAPCPHFMIDLKSYFQSVTKILITLMMEMKIVARWSNKDDERWQLWLHSLRLVRQREGQGEGREMGQGGGTPPSSQNPPRKASSAQPGLLRPASHLHLSLPLLSPLGTERVNLPTWGGKSPQGKPYHAKMDEFGLYHLSLISEQTQSLYTCQQSAV